MQVHNSSERSSGVASFNSAALIGIMYVRSSCYSNPWLLRRDKGTIAIGAPLLQLAILYLEDPIHPSFDDKIKSMGSHCLCTPEKQFPGALQFTGLKAGFSNSVRSVLQSTGDPRWPHNTVAEFDTTRVGTVERFASLTSIVTMPPMRWIWHS
jgi:hypothetical protein